MDGGGGINIGASNETDDVEYTGLIDFGHIHEDIVKFIAEFVLNVVELFKLKSESL